MSRQSLPQPDPEMAWTAILERDRQFDGAFVYAVRSTGIYCRPSCPSRRPLRENVQVFTGAEAAEAAGFRACRRCSPGEAMSPMVLMVRRAAEYIDRRADQSPSLSEVAAHVKVSAGHLQRTFRRLTGLSPAAYADHRRMERLRSGLERGTPVTDAIYDAGFGSASRVYEKSDALLGMTPGAYGRGGKGMRIEHAVVSCGLGLLLVAATEKGICQVSLGDDAERLRESLVQRFPKAELLGASGRLEERVAQVLELVEGRRPSVDLPLDLQGTAFQWLVWNALRRIPRGETRTYKELASDLGQPQSARAVARACASNHAALVIPCHRVIRTDGGLGGYRWGIERKRHLLNAESEDARDEDGS